MFFTQKILILLFSLAFLAPSLPAQAVPLPETAMASEPVAQERQVDASVVERWSQDGFIPSDSSYFSTESQPVEYVELPEPGNIDAIQDSSSAQRLSSPAGVNYGPCLLSLEYLHLRKSGGYQTVGYKAKTTCSEIVESIHHDTDLRYKFSVWWLKAGSTTSSSNRFQRSLYQQNVAFPCKNNNNTTWSGTTAGTIIHKGKPYYARKYVPVNTLACGVQ